ncbi:MAG: hypothetical protein A2312_01095 [Candidatus Staskawiczbacteria bacterium RIFOXYB2_FULL_32_9]|nr:MAG: hypothetical protein A2312_01095 [Candidatus Staskawiczbacteria bacterium RIFOXYB2_FULL_32_9]OGZ88219.1 MAG: hypothetical protein A2463_04485 [Candidatus Staskawiczbacteria bacterium RIFOXYC2_FULL_32_10]
MCEHSRLAWVLCFQLFFFSTKENKFTWRGAGQRSPNGVGCVTTGLLVCDPPSSVNDWEIIPKMVLINEGGDLTGRMTNFWSNCLEPHKLLFSKRLSGNFAWFVHAE